MRGFVTTSQERREAAAASLAQIRASNGGINRIWPAAAVSATSTKGLGGVWLTPAATSSGSDSTRSWCVPIQVA